MRKVSMKIAEKIVKMIEPLTISLVKQQSPKPQKKTYSSTNDLIIPSLRKESLSEQEMKQKEFKLKQRDQELKEMDYALKKKHIVITGIALASPAVTAGIAYQNLKNNVREKDKETQVNKLKAKLNDSKAQVNELKAKLNDSKAQENELKAQDARNQAELHRYKKQEEERLKQSENSLYNRVFGSGRR